MAAKDGDGAAPAVAHSKGGKGMLLMAVVAVIVLVAVAGVGLVLGRVTASGGGGNGKGGERTEREARIGARVTLDEFLVNLADNERYLRTTIAIGLAEDFSEKDMEEKTAPIRDAIVSVLSSKYLRDLRTEEGRETLKTEIKERVNRALDGEKVLAVYFTAFTTQ
ncbi:MAG TPA: flagellar basal body-associated FliL family protein [Chthonomonadales bacterium]|nr:flagellar basal body-associated FliL family protein [Chthonomonadales bacterium]